MRQIGHVIQVTDCRLHEVQLVTGQETRAHPFNNTKSWLPHGTCGVSSDTHWGSVYLSQAVEALLITNLRWG